MVLNMLPGFSGHVFKNIRCVSSFDETNEPGTGKLVYVEKFKNGGEYKVYLSHVTYKSIQGNVL